MMVFWPGLPRLWHDGDVGGLLVAIVFAVLANVTICLTLIWPGLAPAVVRYLCVLGTSGYWMYWAIRQWSRYPTPGPGDFGTEGDLFPQAQSEYLRGNWYQTEELLLRILRRNRQDIEAQLLLATMYRHTGRFAEAAEQLRQVVRHERLPRCQHWRFELAGERQRLQIANGDPARDQPDQDPHMVTNGNATAIPLSKAA